MSLYLPTLKHHNGLEGVRVTLTTAILTILILFFSFRVGLVVYRLCFHPLRKFPGPKLWAASDLPFTYTANILGTSIIHISQFHRKYGPVIRIGPDRIALDGSVGWPQVFARRSAGNAEYEKAPEIVPPALRKSIIASPHDIHRRQRRQLGHAFSDAAMHEQKGTINHYVELLVKRVQEHADAGKEMNIVQWLNFTTFDIIGDLTFGESFGSLESSTYHPWVLGIFRGVRADAVVRACGNYPFCAPLLMFLFGSKQEEEGEVTREFARTKSKARIEQGLEPMGRRDFMTYMLQPNRDGQPGLSTNEIMANSPLLVSAGSETTASALSGFFFYLNQTPRAKEVLVKEIRAAFQDESEIDIISTNKLEYLHATLEETLRMYPPAAATPARVSPGAEIDGKYVPKGTVVYVMQWATFRNSEHFVEPDSFCPERFLKQTHPLYDSKFAHDNHAVFKPFSTGPRDCIGKNLAYSEMRLIVSRLLFKFDMEMLAGQANWHATQVAFIVWDKGPLYIKFMPRKA